MNTHILDEEKQERNSENNGKHSPIKQLTPEQEKLLETLINPDKPTNQFRWADDVQREILAALIRDHDFYIANRHHVPSAYFNTNAHRTIWETTSKYAERFGQLPSRTIATTIFKERVKGRADQAALELELDRVYDHPVSDREYLEDKCVAWAKLQGMRIAYFNALGYVQDAEAKDKEGVTSGIVNDAINSVIGRMAVIKDIGFHWRDPIELEAVFTSSRLPTFPIDEVADIVPEYHAIVRDTTHHLQVPVDLPACLGLAAMGLPLSKRVTVNIRPGDTVPAVVWTLCVLPSGEMKSPVLKRICQPIKDWEKQVQDSYKEVHARKVADRMAAKKRFDEVNKLLAKIPFGDDDRKPLESELVDIQQKLDEPAPVMPRYLIDDATSEATGDLLAVQEGAIACLSSEASFLEVAMGRYSGAPNLEMYMKGWGGEDHQIDRKGKPPILLPEIYLTLGLCVQPDVLSWIASVPHAKDRGFLPRFLMACPRSKLGQRDRKILDEFPAATAHEWRKLVFTMLQQHDRRTLTPNYDLVTDFEARYEAQLGPDQELEPISAWVGKAVSGQMLRLAGVLHVASNEATNNIGDHTILAAIKIVEYFLEHTKRVYQLAATEDVLELARKIKGHVQSTGCETLKPRMILANAGRRAERDTIEAALALCEDCHVIRKGTKNRLGNFDYDVNPVFWHKV